jgi:hypothetical protein
MRSYPHQKQVKAQRGSGKASDAVYGPRVLLSRDFSSVEYARTRPDRVQIRRPRGLGPHRKPGIHLLQDLGFLVGDHVGDARPDERPRAPDGRVRCVQCLHEYLLTFPCKGRYLCPSCHQKRILQFGEWVTEQILPANPLVSSLREPTHDGVPFPMGNGFDLMKNVGAKCDQQPRLADQGETARLPKRVVY